MRTQHKTLLALPFLLLAACSKPDTTNKTGTLSIEDAITRAEHDAKRAHLPDDLREAGDNPKKVRLVYDDAVLVGDERMRHIADAKLASLLVPQAEASDWEGTFRRLHKLAPEGSSTLQQIKNIEKNRLK